MNLASSILLGFGFSLGSQIAYTTTSLAISTAIVVTQLTTNLSIKSAKAVYNYVTTKNTSESKTEGENSLET